MIRRNLPAELLFAVLMIALWYFASQVSGGNPRSDNGTHADYSLTGTADVIRRILAEMWPGTKFGNYIREYS